MQHCKIITSNVGFNPRLWQEVKDSFACTHVINPIPIVFVRTKIFDQNSTSSTLLETEEHMIYYEANEENFDYDGED